VGGQRHASAVIPPGKTWYRLYRMLVGPGGRSGRVRKISSPAGFDPRTVQPVASRYTDWAVHTLCRHLVASLPREDWLQIINILHAENCKICHLGSKKLRNYERKTNHTYKRTYTTTQNKLEIKLVDSWRSYKIPKYILQYQPYGKKEVVQDIWSDERILLCNILNSCRRWHWRYMNGEF
jgi:hypothetical protein